jgi:hypothetical protein
MRSPVHESIERALNNGVCISVYLDDFIGSHNDVDVLTAAYEDIRQTCVVSGFVPNPAKLVPPSAAITAFNCDLTKGSAQLRQDRITKYLASPDRTALSDASFVQYQAMVESRNATA